MATIIPIINQCNQNCLFCSAKGRSDNVNLKLIYKFIDQEKGLIIISGGEPTLSKDLFDIIRYAKNKNLRIELQSNAITLSRFSLTKKLVESKIDLFNINFPSHLESLTDKITQTNGFFGKRIDGIRNLQKLNANIRLTHVINLLTYKELEECVDFIAQNFPQIKYIQFSFIKILGNVWKNLKIVPKYENIKPKLLKALRSCQKYDIDFLVDHIPICFLPGFEKHHVDFIKLKFGQNAEFSLNEKIKLRQCLRCKLNNFCYGVRKDYFELFGQKTKVIPLKLYE